MESALDRGKRAAVDAARLAEELRQEQERSNQIDRVRKSLEFQVKVSVGFKASFGRTAHVFGDWAWS